MDQTEPHFLRPPCLALTRMVGNSPGTTDASSNLKPREPFTQRLASQPSEVVTDLIVQLISLSIRVAIVA